MAEKRPGDIARMLQHGWQRLVASVLDCDKPVIAAVKGTAAGAGSSLVLACDLVVMSTEAKLVEAFVHRGILPDSGAIHLLTRIVGLRKATELLMLGEPVDAATCERLGLVNRVVAPDETDVVAEEIAGRLAQGPTVMLALTKRLLSVSSESGRDRAFEQEAWAAGSGVAHRRPAGGPVVVRRAPQSPVPGILSSAFGGSAADGERGAVVDLVDGLGHRFRAQLVSSIPFVTPMNTRDTFPAPTE